MARHVEWTIKNEHQKNFIKSFNDACSRHNRWTVWADFIMMAAISISNAVDAAHAPEREKSYAAMARKYNKKELECFVVMFSEIINGIDANPNQDFLGDLFMRLELGNDHNGQFFTPYSVCKATAGMTYGSDLEKKVEEQGWVSVCDPACGAGALLIAFANESRKPGSTVNYQRDIMFVAQDIDMIVGCMCYIQLSFLGCPGYVAIGDTLAHPCTSYDRQGLIPRDTGNIWYTPMYFHELWWGRRTAASMDLIVESMAQSLSKCQPEPHCAPAVENESGQLSLF